MKKILKIIKAELRNLLALFHTSRPVASLSNMPLSKICSCSLSQIFVRTFLILFIITIAFIPVIAKDTYVLKTGVSIDEVPDAIFGSWSVQAVIVDSSNYRKFKPKSTDLWNISRQGNVLNLSNPFTGASANVSINAAQGNVVSFTRKNYFDNNQVLIDVVTIRLNENTFSGINDIRLEQYSAVNNKLIKSDSARYEIKGDKLSGDSVLK